MARVPEIIRSTRISQVSAQPGTQAGVGWGALAQMAKAGADFVRPKAIEDAQIAGANSVYRDDTGKLQVDERNVLGGELSDAHNSAAFAKYLSQRSIDTRATMTELATQFQFDPEGFRNASAAYVESLRTDDSAPPLLVEQIAMDAETEASRRFNGLYVEQVDRTNREADRETATQREMLADDYINLMMSGDTEGAAAVMAQIEGITGFRSEAPFISETPAEAEAFLRGTRGAARALQLTRQLDGLQNADSITPEARAEIQTLLNDPDIPAADRSRLYAATDGVLAGIDGRAIANDLAAQGPEAAARNYRTNRPASSFDPTGVTDPAQAALANLEAAAGRTFDITSAFRDPEHNDRVGGANNSQHTHGNAFDIDVRGMSIEERQELIRQARAAGFGGIGVYANSLHFDVGPVRHWGPDYRSASLPGWAAEAVGAPRGGGNAAPSGPPVSDGLTAAGVEPTDGAQFFAGVFGVDATAALFGADPEAMAADVLDPQLIADNPVLTSMSVADAQRWANRQAVVKASDMAANRTQIDMIADPDVRAAALSALNDNIAQRQRLESAAAAEYEARVEARDASLTEAEVLDDNNLADQTQNAIINEIRKQREESDTQARTLADLNDPTVPINPYDNAVRGNVDDVYRSGLNGENPMSQNGMTQAALIAQRTGFIPKTMFDALRGAVNSGDPAALAQALEFSGQVIERNPGALRVHDGHTDITGLLSDYRFLGAFMGADAAAARLVEQNSAEAVANRESITSADARTVARDTIAVGDVKDHLAREGVNVSIPEGLDAQGAIMSDYTRLFEEAYRNTGDRALARNRALDDMSRIYGPSGVGGSDVVMRYPPTTFFPPRNGSHDWLGEQLAAEVNAVAFGAEGPDNGLLAAGVAAVRVATGADLEPLLGERQPIRASDIILTSDGRTARDVAGGRAPTYRVAYMTADGEIVPMPQRFEFTPPPEEAPIARITREQFDARQSYELGREYMMRNPGLFMGESEFLRGRQAQRNVQNNVMLNDREQN
jgi:hypothetical protein